MSCPSRFTLWERPGTHCIGGWVGTRASLDRCGKSRPPPGSDPWTCSELLYRLSYPGPCTFGNSKGLEDEPLRGRLILKECKFKKCTETILSSLRSYLPQKSSSLGSAKWPLHQSNIQDYLTKGGANISPQLLLLNNSKALFKGL
jgi:hypothetical protein